MKSTVDKKEDLYKISNLSLFFEYRALFFLIKSLEKLSTQAENKLPQFESWNNSQVFCVNNLSKAYGELYVFNCFVDRIDKIIDSPTKILLIQLLVLFSLTSFERDLAVFLQYNFISGNSCDLIKDEILNLCFVLKDQMISIIDVIAPPDEILGAPLGSSEGHVIDIIYILDI